MRLAGRQSRLGHLSKTLFQRLFKQQVHGTRDDDSQITARNLMPKQMLQLPQLVMQLLTRSHLQTETPRPQWSARSPRSFQRECHELANLAARSGGCNACLVNTKRDERR